MCCRTRCGRRAPRRSSRGQPWRGGRTPPLPERQCRAPGPAAGQVGCLRLGRWGSHRSRALHAAPWYSRRGDSSGCSRSAWHPGGAAGYRTRAPRAAGSPGKPSGRRTRRRCSGPRACGRSTGGRVSTRSSFHLGLHPPLPPIRGAPKHGCNRRSSQGGLVCREGHEPRRRGRPSAELSPANGRPLLPPFLGRRVRALGSSSKIIRRTCRRGKGAIPLGVDERGRGRERARLLLCGQSRRIIKVNDRCVRSRIICLDISSQSGPPRRDRAAGKVQGRPPHLFSLVLQETKGAI